MTYKSWTRTFKKELKSLPKSERERALEYYNEMHDEMASHGKSENAILAELGSPVSCAKQTLAEGNFSSGQERGNNKPVKKERTTRSFAEVLGLLFATLLLVLPGCAVLFSVIVAMGSVCIAGAAVAIGGILVAVAYPFFVGAGTIAAAGAGAGLTASGVGILLFVIFFLVTKYSAIFSVKLLKAIYKRR